MAKRGLGRLSKRASGVSSGSKAFVRHPGQVYGHSNGSRPGQKHFYNRVYSIEAWDDFLRLFTVGTLAQVCCGASTLGTIRVDIDSAAPGVNVIGDMYALPLGDQAVDTVACDPIYGIGFPERVTLRDDLEMLGRLGDRRVAVGERSHRSLASQARNTTPAMLSPTLGR